MGDNLILILMLLGALIIIFILIYFALKGNSNQSRHINKQSSEEEE